MLVWSLVEWYLLIQSQNNIWLQKQPQTYLTYLVHLDNFLVIPPSTSPPAYGLSTLKSVYSELGVPLTEEKTEGPWVPLYKPRHHAVSGFFAHRKTNLNLLLENLLFLLVLTDRCLSMFLLTFFRFLHCSEEVRRSPYEPLTYYLNLRKSRHTLASDLLFITESSHVATGPWFLSHIPRVLFVRNFFWSFLWPFLPHRAATSTSCKGIPDHLIKLLGR